MNEVIMQDPTKPYAVPAREDNYNGGFWKYTTRLTKNREEEAFSESDATITERIQGKWAASYSTLPAGVGFEEVTVTPLRFILRDGGYHQSGADRLTARAVYVRLRYTDMDGEVQAGTKYWHTRVGLYILHQEMLKGVWSVIELIPESYERSQPTFEEDVEWCRAMLYPSGKPESLGREKTGRPRRYKTPADRQQAYRVRRVTKLPL